MGGFRSLRCFEGDSISVFSAGRLLGHGTFLRIEGFELIWFDRRGDLNVTDLRVSSIKKRNFGCCEERFDEIEDVDDCCSL